MSEVRVEMWAKMMSRKRVSAAPQLKSLPPTSEALAQNVRRARTFPSSDLEVCSFFKSTRHGCDEVWVLGTKT